jgi:hypothetical protein
VAPKTPASPDIDIPSLSRGFPGKFWTVLKLARLFLGIPGASRWAAVFRNRLRMDDAQYGPAMLALTEKQRRFVLAMASDPFGNPTKWARAAGYSDVGEGAKVRGFEAMHNPAVEEAVLEYARGQLNTLGPILATYGMLRIARNPRHPKHVKALEMLANRVGMHETTEHRVIVNHTDKTGETVMERIKAAAEKLGVDPSALLGENVAAPPMKLIEGVVEEKT